MARPLRDAYSYRRDPAVPAFPDAHPVIVFDGHCGFCSAWARFVLRFDRAATFRLLPAQSELGRALYVHYGFDANDFETNILLENGVASFKAEASIRMFESLGPPWSAARALRLIPRSLLDRAYDVVARNRQRIWGRRAVCFPPTAATRERFLA